MFVRVQVLTQELSVREAADDDDDEDVQSFVSEHQLGQARPVKAERRAWHTPHVAQTCGVIFGVESLQPACTFFVVGLESRTWRNG